MNLRSILALVLALAALPAWAAENYPARPIRIVVTYVPGATR